jgi:hypothetical protein
MAFPTLDTNSGFPSRKKLFIGWNIHHNQFLRFRDVIRNPSATFHVDHDFLMRAATGTFMYLMSGNIFLSKLPLRFLNFNIPSANSAS